MRKLFTALLMIPAIVAASAQTEKTRGFDDLYHFIENLDVFECGQEESRAYYIPGHHVLLNGTMANGSSFMVTPLRRYQVTSSRRNTPMRSGQPSTCRRTGR